MAWGMLGETGPRGCFLLADIQYPRITDITADEHLNLIPDLSTEQRRTERCIDMRDTGSRIIHSPAECDFELLSFLT